MLLRPLLLLAAALAASPTNAAELVRVRISQFTGAEPLSISSASHPGLFLLDPSIASASLTADNPSVPEIENTGPATWLPVMTPVQSGTPVAGAIELTVTPVGGMPASPGAIRFHAAAIFPGNPSSFVLAWSRDAFAAPLAVLDTASTGSTHLLLSGAASDDPFTFRWTAGNDFGERGGGQAGFSGEDIVVTTASCPAAPASDCAGPGRASLSLRGDADPARQRLVWTWSRGSAAPADFDDPRQSSLATFCLYDERGLVMSAPVDPDPCGAKRCWKAQRNGFSYKSRTGGTSGVTSLKLKAGDGTAAIALRGSGALLELPLPMAAATGVRAQLVNSVSDACFESVFPAPAAVDEALEFEDSLP